MFRAYVGMGIVAVLQVAFFVGMFRSKSFRDWLFWPDWAMFYVVRYPVYGLLSVGLALCIVGVWPAGLAVLIFFGGGWALTERGLYRKHRKQKEPPPAAGPVKPDIVGWKRRDNESDIG